MSLISAAVVADEVAADAPWAGGGIGLLAVVVIGYFLGVDLTPLLSQQGGVPQQQQMQTGALSAEEQQAAEFASRVLATTEDVWGEVYPVAFDAAYNPPSLVLFSGSTQSACGGLLRAVLLPR